MPKRATPITPDTLFQIGSISKLMNAAVLHQLAAEGRFRLTDRISALLPALRCRRATRSTSSTARPCRRAAGDAPAVPRGGLWTAYRAGRALALFEHRLRDARHARRASRRQAARPPGRGANLHAARHAPQSRGAIIERGSRRCYAQGYEAADELPFALGVPLAPAAWVDVTFGAGNVASTAEDMNRLLRSLAERRRAAAGSAFPRRRARAFATACRARATRRR